MQWDLIVVGSGAAGLTAAIVAARSGLKVLVLEKTAYFGGTTAVSGGGLWIPGNHLAEAAGYPDTLAAARAYIKALLGNAYQPEMIDAFLAAAPEMLKFMERETEARFAVVPYGADAKQDLPGATRQGRFLRTLEYDARKLGGLFSRLRPPRAEFNAPGGLMLDLPDLPHIAKVRSSWRSRRHLAGLVFRFGLDRLGGWPRGARLTMGNALAARLLRSAADAGVTLRRNAAVTELARRDDCVTGVVVDGEHLAAKRGVVLATGGGSASEQWRRQYLPYADEHVSIAAEGATGDGVAMALEVGAVTGEENTANGVWSVVSHATNLDGSKALYAHLLDMAKPGCIAVDQAGLRFANEAAADFVDRLHDAGAVPAYLIADRAFVKAYGFGMIYPGGLRLGSLLKKGYVVEGDSLWELAEKLGIDPSGLEQTVSKMNSYAETGKDLDFHKGEKPQDLAFGDPEKKPNACLGKVGTPPYYAIRIHPGSAASTVGVRIDAHARVLNSSLDPIPGLYAAGIDIHQLWRGRTPANGTNIGPAMTIGYIAARHAAERT